MLKLLLKPFYKITHDFLFDSIDYNPFVRFNNNGKKIRRGHISIEHLQNPKLDEELAENLRNSNIPVKEYSINKAAYEAYLKEADYPETYYGGGLDAKQNFTEKTLEHFVSLDFLNLSEGKTFIDIAACTSPFYTIVKENYNLANAYQQDLIFKKGLNGDKIGGYASEIPLPDNSVDAVTLHCSLEHFEGTSDMEFFAEMNRVLKPGGKVVILPFYIAYEYTIHIDPAFNLLKQHQVQIDDNKATIRYCDWYQYFSRHYDVQAIRERILRSAPDLRLEVHKVKNYKDIDSSCYLRFVGVLTKR